MRKHPKFLELFLIIAAGVLLGAFVIDHFVIQADAAVPEIKLAQMPKHLEVVLGASLGAANYNVGDCQPSCNSHVGTTGRWGLIAQLVTMKPRKAHNIDLGLEVGMSDTLNADLNNQGDASDRIYHLVPFVRIPVYKKPGITGSANLKFGAGIGRAKTRFAMNDGDIHTDSGNAFVALGGVQLLLNKHVTLALEFRHDDLGNATFQTRRDCEKPRTLSLDRTMNTVGAVLEWHL